MADHFLERTENIQKEDKQHLQDRLLFDASMKKKKFSCEFLFYYFTYRPTVQKCLVKVSINTESKNHGLIVNSATTISNGDIIIETMSVVEVLKA